MVLFEINQVQQAIKNIVEANKLDWGNEAEVEQLLQLKKHLAILLAGCPQWVETDGSKTTLIDKLDPVLAKINRVQLEAIDDINRRGTDPEELKRYFNRDTGSIHDLRSGQAEIGGRSTNPNAFPFDGSQLRNCFERQVAGELKKLFTKR